MLALVNEDEDEEGAAMGVRRWNKWSVGRVEGGGEEVEQQWI